MNEYSAVRQALVKKRVHSVYHYIRLVISQHDGVIAVEVTERGLKHWYKRGTRNFTKFYDIYQQTAT